MYTFVYQVPILVVKNLRIEWRRRCTILLKLITPLFFAGLLALVLKVATEKNDYGRNGTFHFLNENKFFGPVLYVPKVPATEKLMDVVTDRTVFPWLLAAKGYDTEEEAEKVIQHSNLSAIFNLHLLVFNNVSESTIDIPNQLTVRVRPRVYTKSANVMFDPKADERLPRKNPDPDFHTLQTMELLMMLTKGIIHYTQNSSNITGNNISSDKSAACLKWRVDTLNSPFPPYDVKTFKYVDDLLPVFLMITFLIHSATGTMSLVLEKESGVKDSLKTMGVSNQAYVTSWYLYFYVVTLPANFLITLVVWYNGYVSFDVLFVFLLVYSCAFTSYCFLITSFLRNEVLAAVVSCGVYQAMYMEADQYSMTGRPKSEVLLYCLNFNLAFKKAFKMVDTWAHESEDLSWANINEPVKEDVPVTFLDLTLVLVVDAVLYMVVAWYMDKVFPGKYGIPMRPDFIFTRAYWSPNMLPLSEVEPEPIQDPSKFEQEPLDLDVGIRMCSLTKKYGEFYAVNNVNLNMYNGQITVLLGHNGAGKSTLINMLSGHVPPTKGTATVLGNDVVRKTSDVRKDVSVCLQQDSFFDKLTVEEHIGLFIRMKGFLGNVREEIRRVVALVGIGHVVSHTTNGLSGGERRKLSIAIALAGNRKILILDEPTTGIDVEARRAIWNSLLEEKKRGKTIMLSTHYMDEADVLSDRIAILSHGVLHCCGSSMFLKEKYGKGYRLVIVTLPGYNLEALSGLVAKHVPSAAFIGVVSSEVSYQLPLQDSDKFPSLFREMQSNASELKISDFGLQITSMEEVFLNVDQEIEEAIDANASAIADDPSIVKETETKGQGATEPNEEIPSAQPTGDARPSLETVVTNLQEDQPTTDPGTNVPTTTELRRATQRTLKRLNSEVWNVEPSQGFNRILTTILAIVTKRLQIKWSSKFVTVLELFGAIALIQYNLWGDHDTPTGPGIFPLDLSEFRNSVVVTNTKTNNQISHELTDIYHSMFTGHQIESFNNYSKWNGDRIKKHLLRSVTEQGISAFNKKHIIAMESEYHKDYPVSYQHQALAIYNSFPNYAMPISVNYVLNMYLKWCLGDDHSLTTSIQPLPVELNTLSDFMRRHKSDVKTTLDALKLWMLIVTFLMFALHLSEKRNGTQRVQFLYGASALEYWTVNLLLDIVYYVIVASLALGSIFLHEKATILTEDGRPAAVIVLFLVFGISQITTNSVFIQLFPKLSTGFLVIPLFIWISDVVPMLRLFVFKDGSDWKDWGLVLIPSLNYYEAEEDLVQNVLLVDYCKGQDRSAEKGNCLNISGFDACCPECLINCLPERTENYLSDEKGGIGEYVLYMLIQTLVAYIVVVIFDSTITWTVVQRVSESLSPLGSTFHTSNDDDVNAEHERIKQLTPSLGGSNNPEPLVISGLAKTFCGDLRVKHVSVGVAQGECFGLLGQNGAGKTSIFKMLIRDYLISGGEAFINGLSVNQQSGEIYSQLGYCSQAETFIPSLTVQQNVVFYCRLKGMGPQKIVEVTDYFLDVFNLSQYRHRVVEHLSGGNKRKTSVVISLLGRPSLILMDEPSAGMDPRARRNMWAVLFAVREMGATLVLTSHSMDECEALCTRVCIMVNGDFVCLGSPQHLKSKYAQGYTVVVKMQKTSPDTTEVKGKDQNVENVINYVQTVFKMAVVFDMYGQFIHFQIQDRDIVLADLFELMEKTRELYKVESYTVQQTSLEQLFLLFARDQTRIGLSQGCIPC